MTVKEKGWFWFLDESGSFTREKLDENRMRLIAFYPDDGFINVQVGAPHVDIHDDPSRSCILFAKVIAIRSER